MRTRNVSIIASVLLAFCCCSVAQTGWKAYYGDLHTHTEMSDGSGTPEEAIAYAKGISQAKNVQFLALTDHNHMLDAQRLEQICQAAKKETDASFVVLYGQEFSTIENGNHINIFDTETPIPGKYNNNFKEIYTRWLQDYQQQQPKAILVGQFNHPKSVAKDYGIAAVKNGAIPNYKGDWDSFLAESGRWVSLIALSNGPAEHKSGESVHDLHQDIQPARVRAWFTYLDKGFHLAPTGNHDTHMKSWGDLTTNRTGVWIKGAFNRQGLLEALRDGHCFSTEDQNLSVWFGVDGQPMGTQLSDAGDQTINLEVLVTDGDEPNSEYIVEIYRDKIRDDSVPDEPIVTKEADSGMSCVIPVEHTGGEAELLLAHVKQVGRDDDAWTAPIYIGPGAVEPVDPPDAGIDDGVSVPAGVVFVGSSKRDIYHYPSCSAVQKIKPENLEEYQSAPSNKTLHKGCPQ